MIVRVATITAALAIGLAGGSAEAKEKADLLWPLDQVLGTAVRFLRVDRGCKVTDRDDTSAFLMFECAGDPGKPPHRGSLELFRVDTQGRDAVRAQISLSDEPSYIEKRFLELLERKLRDERGSPPPARPAPAPVRPARDGGA
ncbi:MAG: hypothetical protein EXR72_09365 [Myxococcales bacterium]|nr:hypothetical protein [Myxococcales bacterium]